MARTRTCPVCKTKFEKKYSGHTYCSRRCYHISTRKKHKRTKCEQCGRPLGGVQLQRDRRFCSRACYEKSRRTETITKHCPVCGKDFTVPAKIADRYTVCSRVCRTAETKYLNCKRCGKPFRGEKHLNRHYCSEECRRPPKIVTCKNCGKDFRDVPSNGRKFCSFACYRRFSGENSLERLVRLTLQAMDIEFIQEYRLGRYSVDFLLTQHKIALEIDGAYWHQDKQRDARKNAYLQRHNLHVIRISDKEIEQADLASLISHRIRQCLGESSSGTEGAQVDSQYLAQNPLLPELLPR